MDVLIFDDDPTFAELVAEVVQSLGYSAEKAYDAFTAIQTIKAAKPQLIIMDIMMPGVDGLTLCSTIKSNPDLCHIHVIAISAKAFQQDREEALRCGADLFLPKPCDMQTLKRAVVERMGGPSKGASSARAPAFYARVFGSRSLSTDPGAPPTSCVLVGIKDRFIILDAGSGLAGLARTHFDCSELWLLLTHFHEDHICGLPYLKDLAGRVRKISIAGPTDTRRPLQDILRERLKGVSLPAGSEVHNVAESSFMLWPDVRVVTMFTRHPGSTLAYRIIWGNHSLVYCPDNELEPQGETQSDFRAKFTRFVRGADVLLHDARYSDEALASQPKSASEEPSGRTDPAPEAGGPSLAPGHSCPSRAVDLALEAGCRELALFHLDASYGDESLDHILLACQLKLRKRHASLTVSMAQPGSSFGV